MTAKTAVSRIVYPYAEALIAIGQETNTIDCINKDVNIISLLLKDSKEFKDFLLNPLISNTDKKNLVKNILNEQISDNFLRFLMVLFDRNRIIYLESILQVYLELSYDRLSIKVAEVFSASALSSEQQKTLVDKLRDMTGAKQVKLVLKIDKELIGGFTIQLGSRFIDKSIKGQLNQMANCLSSSSI
jgi:F-type H+-transporting ATPase subunit delta